MVPTSRRAGRTRLGVPREKLWLRVLQRPRRVVAAKMIYRTFAITERAIEDYCYGHNSLGIELDEEGRSFGGKRATRVSATELSYTIASGRGGVRSTKATRDVNLKNRKWVLNAISSGELPLDDPNFRSARAEGEQVRMIGLPVPPGSKGGIFNRAEDNVAKMARCAARPKQTESTICELPCGVPGLP
jgi:hypothetical protein